MKRTVVNCEFCYNKTIIGHEDDEMILFCPICGEHQEEDLEELDFDE